MAGLRIIRRLCCVPAMLCQTDCRDKRVGSFGKRAPPATWTTGEPVSAARAVGAVTLRATESPIGVSADLRCVCRAGGYGEQADRQVDGCGQPPHAFHGFAPWLGIGRSPLGSLGPPLDFLPVRLFAGLTEVVHRSLFCSVLNGDPGFYGPATVTHS
jgi:hypothetical protein